MRFTSLQLRNWRNFLSAGPVPLQQRMFLIGPNACGKSNLLDVFRFLHDVAKPGGGLRYAVEDSGRGGVSRIRCLAARKTPEVAIEVHAGEDAGSVEWTYRLEFKQSPSKQPIVKREQVLHRGRVVLDRPDADDRNDEVRLSQTHLEQVSANAAFREFAKFLAGVRYLHVVPQLIREPERYVRRDQDPYGSDLLEQIAGTRTRLLKSRLRRMGEALRVAVPQLGEIELVRDSRTGAPHLRAKYEHWRPQGAWQTEHDLSDGTLRLLGLLWAAMAGEGPILLEEPELSLSPAIVRQIPSLFAQVLRSGKSRVRQYIVSTHSWEMLEDRGVAPDEVLVLTPGVNGTEVKLAKAIDGVEEMVRAELSVRDAVSSLAEPPDVHTLLKVGV